MSESKKSQLIKISQQLKILPDLSFKSGVYKKVYKLAKNFYKNDWRGNEKPSPALNGRTVKATNYGFRHLVGKTKTSSYSDAIKRLNHLLNAKQILETTDFVYEIKKEIDRNKLINRYVILGRLENGLVLKVIVKEIDNTLIFVTAYPSIEIKNG